MSEKINSLIIVESPSKAKTLKKYLGNKYIIEASVGHVRDLAKKDLGIDIDNNFKPTYVISPDKKKVITSLKAAMKKANMLYLATDPDREGEAISWHLLEILKPKIPVKRLVFHEFTKSAIVTAFDDIRDIDKALIDAQETRRILDRLFGFQVSPKLWYNVKGGLSAGRVQSPAIKIIVDREKLRMSFKTSEYWDIIGDFSAKDGNFSAVLQSIDGQKIAMGKDFDKSTGKLAKKNTFVLDKNQAEKLANSFKDNQWSIASIDQKTITSNPYAPFITSTLQQDSIRKLRMSSQQVMRIAQKLYENGYITYMRTDSVTLSSEAINASRKIIEQMFGSSYLPSKPRTYKSKVKNAQEAHEAIRPAGSDFKNPQDLKSILPDDEWKLYNLIWKRTIASQMKSAKLLQTKANVSDGNAIFRANGKIVEFPGFLKVYSNEIDDDKKLPKLENGEVVKSDVFTPKQHFTKPAPRFNEASLIKELESLGIGRPSTYASIMSTIQQRGYVNKVKGTLQPTFTAFAVVHFLEKYFDDLVDLQFTANLEDKLDQISRSEMKGLDFMNAFYFGLDSHLGLKAQLEQEFDKNITKTVCEVMDEKGNPIKIKIGRYGLYFQNNDTNITIPEEIAPGDFTPSLISTLIDKKETIPENLGNSLETDEPIFLKDGRFGPYLQCGKKMKSLLPGMKMEEVTTDIAQKIMQLPKNLGVWLENDQPISADIGRYGPYIKCGKETRKVIGDDIIINLTYERAVELLLTKSKASGPVVLKELGVDKESEKTIELKDGRYGAYVTDGKTNATLPKSVNIKDITLEDAIELIKAKALKPKRKFKRKKK
jgi:DNA topoisomerase I